jgi:hypothetical protein
MIFRKYFFQKLTQISLGNNVVDAAASYFHGFIGEIHLFLHFCRRSLFGTK